MSEISREENEGEDRDILISKLTDKNTSLAERISLAKELFSDERKKEMIDSADMDNKGRPVRYFRTATYEELRAILNSDESNPLQNPLGKELFSKKANQVQNSLKSFLKKENIYEQFKKDFDELCSDFTLENYRKFVQSKLPRIELFKLHISAYGGGGFTDITSLKSLSVGVPGEPPCDPSGGKPGFPVVEFSIPSDEVHVHPLFKTMNIEMEKEVNTLILKPEWIVDVYNGTEDFAERFVKDPQGVLYTAYQQKKENGDFVMDYVGESSVWDILQNWKHTESVADLMPVRKLTDIDENSPNLQTPLIKNL